MLIQYPNVFNYEIFEQAGMLYQGKMCFKNVVRLNNKEPDPKGYIREIQKVEFLTRDKVFAEIHHPGISIKEIDIKI